MTPALPGRAAWIRFAVTAAILIWLARTIDAGEALRAMAGIGPAVLLGVLALVALDRAVMVWRWVVLLRAIGVTVATKSATWIFLVSSFVGSFLPAGVGADAARAWTLARRDVRGSEAVASVAVDRLLGVIALALLGGAGGLLWVGAGAGSRSTTVVVALAALAGSVATLWIDRLVRGLVPARVLETALGVRLVRLADAVSRYRRTPRALVSVLLLSLAVQVLRVLQAWVLGLGLGLQVPFLYYLLFMPIGLLMLLLPISVAGFGVPQGVIVWLLRPVGVDDSLAFALSTLIVLSGLAGNLPGALLYLTRKSK